MTSRDCFSWLVCCVLAGPLSCHAAAGLLEFQLSDLQKIVKLSDSMISPDGKLVAVVVSTPDWKADKDQQEIDIIDVASGARRALTWKRTGISSPKWSEDGTRLAFLAEDSTPNPNPKEDADKD